MAPSELTHPMVVAASSKAGLFIWESASALKHHCGCCSRPLSHPEAKTLCLYTHCEPCHRFHQMLFMRNRSHTCAHCVGWEEAHHKRHISILETVRKLFELSGVPHRFNLPLQSDEAHPPIEADDEIVSSNVSIDGPRMTKKERKEARKLTRAALRPRVITAAEVKLMGEIMHPNDDSPEDLFAPANTEELEKIEMHLRYHKQLYNDGVKHSTLRDFVIDPKLATPMVDFANEVNRILDCLGINELLIETGKRLGTQAKETKVVNETADRFKTMLVDDLFEVAREKAETRMRRAGFLRWANRDQVELLQDRRKHVDPRTGVRLHPIDERPAPFVMPQVEEEIDDALDPHQDRQDGIAPNQPDLRHLEMPARLVHGPQYDNYQNLVPLLSTPESAPTLSNAPTLRIVTEPSRLVVENTSDETATDLETSSPHDDMPLILFDQVETAALASESPTIPEPNFEGSVTFQNPSPTLVSELPKNQTPSSDEFLLDEEDSTSPPEFVHSTASLQSPETGHSPVRQRMPKKAKSPATLGVQFVPKAEEANLNTSPLVSNKKTNKAKHAAKRKARQATETKTPITITKEIVEAFLKDQGVEYDDSVHAEEDEDEEDEAALSHHDDWLDFNINLEVDTLSHYFTNIHDHCPFCDNSVPINDCPYHDPCKFRRSLPPYSLVVMPIAHGARPVPICIGPYTGYLATNYVRLFDKHEELKGRVMVVEDVVMTAIMSGMSDYNTGIVPKALREEIDQTVLDNQTFRNQMNKYKQLAARNMDIADKYTIQSFQEIQAELEDAEKHLPKICYCTAPAKGWSMKSYQRIISCSHADCKIRDFHFGCVKAFGAGTVSRWYCIDCTKAMDRAAKILIHGKERVKQQEEAEEKEKAKAATATKSSMTKDAAIEDLKNLRADLFKPTLKAPAAGTRAPDVLYSTAMAHSELIWEAQWDPYFRSMY